MKNKHVRSVMKNRYKPRHPRLLRLKAWLYRLGFPYLAHREENDYLDSVQFWYDLENLHRKNKDLNLQNCASILIGMWQCDYKFYRTFRKGWFR